MIGKIKKKISLGLNDLRSSLDSNRILDDIKPFKRILLYHGIDDVGNTKINSRFISRNDFEKQILFFKEHFQVVSLCDYFEGRYQNTKPVVCITFDDGYANNYTNALPILEKHKVPATIFITAVRDSGNEILWADVLDLAAYRYKKPFNIKEERFSLKGNKGYVSEKTKIPLKVSIKLTDHKYKLELQKAIPAMNDILKEKNLRTYWELLLPDQIREMSRSPYITIGSHGYYHNCLDQLNETDLKFELVASKKWLQEITGKAVTALAFPDGTFSEKVIIEAKKTGYRQFLSVDGKMNDKEEDLELRSRMGMNPHISFHNQMLAVIKGKY